MLTDTRISGEDNEVTDMFLASGEREAINKISIMFYTKVLEDLEKEITTDASDCAISATYSLVDRPVYYLTNIGEGELFEY